MAVGSGGCSPPTSHTDAVTSSTARASAATAKPAPLVIDGWLCDDANPFGHSVCREVRQLEGDWPAALVLTSGDGPDDSSTRIDVPERVLRWLLTGEVPTNV